MSAGVFTYLSISAISGARRWCISLIRKCGYDAPIRSEISGGGEPSQYLSVVIMESAAFPIMYFEYTSVEPRYTILHGHNIC